jgi:glycosyltransferase involved in cell wall biosynthesis
MSTTSVSVVIPCLNEQDTLATCIEAAVSGLHAANIDGEVIVADNGSTDDSAHIGRSHGARIVSVLDRGYGVALMAGIDAAHGDSIVMGDADASYDFQEIPKFLAVLQEGADLVMGCRLTAGGGTIEPSAMPFLHRWIGNPFFSWMARRWFGTPVHDIYCGLRAFRRSTVERLDLRCTGMEFATEMVIKASLLGFDIREVPITLHRDGRTNNRRHLKTFRDGWRTLRFFLLCAPNRLFIVPGVALCLAGLVAYALALPAMSIRGVTFDAHTLLFGSLSAISGYQALLVGLLAKTFAVSERLLPPSRTLVRVQEILSPDLWLGLGTASLIFGAILLLLAVNQWRVHDFGALDYATTMRLVVPGVTAATLGFQTILNCFLLSLFALRRR